MDAKALYDLLVKPEVQAASELQYADGLTKDSAAQLLADRLRSHLTRLKADESFQAAKKKDASQRKKNAGMYAIKKPKRALQSMLATVMMANTLAQPGGESYIYIDQSRHLLVYLMAMFVLCNYFCTSGIRIYNEVRQRFPRNELPEPEVEPADPGMEIEQETLHGLPHEGNDPGVHEGELHEEPQHREVGIHAVSPEVDLYREIAHRTHRAEHFSVRNYYER